jgi:hypothetical protein
MFSRALMVRVAALLLIMLSMAICIEAQERGHLDATQVQIRQRQREPATGSSGGVTSGYTEGQIPTQSSLSLWKFWPRRIRSGRSI